eukprot:m.21502 g.21502  ORF g.21502 m.21502 type:complete len:52 (+) comp7160_c1_seq1:420-575(+)
MANDCVKTFGQPKNNVQNNVQQGVLMLQNLNEKNAIACQPLHKNTVSCQQK